MDRVAAQVPVPRSSLSHAAIDIHERQLRASAVAWIGGIRQWFRAIPLSRVVDIGWTLRHSKASFIWEKPRAVPNKGPRLTHAKVVSLCPAVLDQESRLIEITCPIDARIRFQRDARGRLVPENALGDASPIRSNHLGQMVKLVSEKDRRHP